MGEDKQGCEVESSNYTSESRSLAWTMRDLLGPYASYFNQKHALSGRLWQGRFFSSVLDESHFWAALRYVERNPVRAGMVKRAEDYRWSSAPAHCRLRGDPLLAPLPNNGGLIPDWSAWVSGGDNQAELKMIRNNTKTGRPCGSEAFVDKLEGLLGRTLRPRRGGRPKKPLNL